MKKELRELRMLCASEGVEVVSMRSCGRASHYKCLLRAPDGREEQTIFTVHIGDPRALANKRAALRRFAKGQSIHPQPTKEIP